MHCFTRSQCPRLGEKYMFHGFGERSSQLWSNLSSYKESLEKILRLQRDLNPWPPRYRCDDLPTELWSLAGSRSGVSSIYTRCMKRMMWSVYDKDHMSEVQIENRSERDLRSCEVTWAVTIRSSLIWSLSYTFHIFHGFVEQGQRRCAMHAGDVLCAQSSLVKVHGS